MHIRFQLDVMAAYAIKRVSIDDVYVTFVDVTPDTNVSGSNSVNYIFSADSAGVRMDPAGVASIASSIRITLPCIVGGRIWEARFAASNKFVAERVSFTPYFVAIVLGLVFAMAVGGGL
jgi:hypothetical protein